MIAICVPCFVSVVAIYINAHGSGAAATVLQEESCTPCPCSSRSERRGT